MPARKQHHVSFHVSYSLPHVVSTRCGLRWRFAARSTVAKQFPVRTLRTNFNGPEPFVLAIVPLDQVAFDFSIRTESSQFAGPSDALKGTCEDLRELKALQPSR